MVSKNNKKLIQEKNRRNVHQRFALRKFNVGVASVLVGVAFSLYGGGQLVAHADTTAPAQNGGVQTGSETGSQKLTSQNHVTLTASSSSAASDASATETQASSAQATKQGSSAAQSASNDAKNSSAQSMKQSTNSAAQSASSDIKNSSAQTTKQSSKTEKSTTSEVKSQSVKNDDQAKTFTGAKASGTNKTVLDSANKGTEVTKDAKTSDTETLNLSNVKKNSAVSANTLATSLVEEPTNSQEAVTVTDWDSLRNAIEKGTATDIIIGKDINSSYSSWPGQTAFNIAHKRNITIESAAGKRYAVNFNGYTASYGSGSNDNAITFKNVDVYGTSYFGPINNARTYNFDNMTYTGSQMVFTNNGTSTTGTTVNFNGNVTVKSLHNSYTFKDPKTLKDNSYSVQGGNQQVLQFTSGVNKVNFAAGSNVNLIAENSHVIEVDAGGSVDIDVANGANVTLEPHTVTAPENLNGFAAYGISRAIASKGKMNLTIDPNANLVINLNKSTNDNHLSSAFDIESGATITDNGNLTITSTDAPNMISAGWDDPVYINGKATVEIGKNATFALNATNLGSYKGHLFTAGAGSTVKLDPHSTFKISGDGTNVTAINMGTGATFTSDQPQEFSISLPNNAGSASFVKNGTIDFTRVKTHLSDGSDSAPMHEINVTYGSNGKPTINTISGPNKDGVNAVQGIVNDANAKSVYFTLAGEDVVLNNVYYDSKTHTLHGNASSNSGNQGNYIKVDINGVTNSVKASSDTNAKSSEWVVDKNNPNGHTVTTSYQGVTDKDGNFTISLVDSDGNALSLKDTDKINITATRNYVDSETKTITVADAKAAEKLATARQNLQDAINAANKAKAGYQYLNDNSTPVTENKTPNQSALDSQLNNANGLLTSTDPDAITKAVTALNTAVTNLNGQPTDTKTLQSEVTKAGTDNAAALADSKLANPKTTLGQAIKDAQTILDSAKAYSDALSQTGTPEDPTKVDTTKTPFVTQNQVQNALSTLQAAEDSTALDQAKTNLRNELNTESNVEKTHQFYNDSKEDRDAYTKALSAANDALKGTDTSAMSTALANLKNAYTALNGDRTSTGDLDTLVKGASDEKNSDAFKGATADQQKAYTDAIKAAQDLQNKKAAYDAAVTKVGDEKNVNTSTIPYVTNDDVKTATDKINSALNAIAKQALQNAVNDEPNVKKTEAYTKASRTTKDAYNSAIVNGNKVLTNPASTTADYQNALQRITDSKTGLDGDYNASKQALQDAVDAAPTERQKHDYYNADKDAQDAYDSAITKGQNILSEANPKQADITNALTAINTAKDNLKGKATDKTALQNAVNGADAQKAEQNYTSASQAKKDAYDQAISTGQTLLNDPNATQAEVDNATQAITDAINGLDGNSNATQTSKKALQTAVDAAPDVRADHGYYNASDKAQKAYDDAIKAGQTVLNEANPTKEALDNALKAINDAKSNLKGKATDKTALQNAVNGADAQKADPNYASASQAKKDAYDQAISNGQTVLNNPDATQAQVDSAAQKITDAINGLDGNNNIAQLNKAKNDAKLAIQQALNSKKEDIDGLNNLTDEEKNSLKKQASDAATAAKAAIDNAKTNAAVTDAENTGKTAISNVKAPATTAKSAAIAAINNALDAKNKTIDAATNLTKQEQQALKDQAQAAAKTAKDNINKATTNAGVSDAQNAGIKAIDDINIPSLADKQSSAIAAIDSTLATKKQQISNATNLSDAEKADLNKQAEDAATNAKDNINTATTNDAVDKAESDGIIAINNVNVPTLAEQKTKAHQAIADALAAKQNEIKAATNLSQAQQDQLNNDAQKAADDANAAIDAAANDDAINTAEANGIAAINNVTVPSLASRQSAAIAEVKAAQYAKIADIKKATYLTTDESQKLTDDVNKAADDAVAAINSAKTNDGVDAAKTTGIANINKISIPADSTAKTAAKADIDKAANAKNDAIDANKNLTNEEKQSLKDQVNKAADNAKSAIDKATSDQAVQDAQKKGTDAIDQINVPTDSAAKSAAKADIDKAANAKNDVIDANKNLTNEEKQSLKDQVNKAADNAKSAIDKATSDQAVQDAQKKGTDAIDQINVPTDSAAKSAAKADIDKAANAKNDAIDANKNLTNEEKQSLKDQVNKAADDAKSAIDKATSDQGVQDAQKKGIDAIDKINVPTDSAAKTAAKNAIDKAADAKKSAIDANKNLTNEEKNALKDQVNKAADDAKSAIDKATSDQAVQDAQKKGTDSIDQINVPTDSTVKTAAKQAINDALKNKQNEINNADNLTQPEKDALNKQAQDAADTANANIDKATTNAGVDQAKSDGLKNLSNVQVPSLDEAKDAANQAIDNALKNKQNEINGAANLTQDEKDALNKQVTDAAKAAKDNIAKATTNDAVNQAEANGIDAINGVHVPSLADKKNDSKSAIDSALKAKQNEINSAANLNKAQKDDLNKQAQDAADQAKKNIDNATNDAAVKSAETNGINAINGIHVPSLADQQKQADNAINDALAKKQDEIKNASHLTDAEKADLNKQATDAANAAKENIAKATTNDDVTKAEQEGLNNINGVHVPTLAEQQTAAKAAIAAAQQAKNAEIDNAKGLSDNAKASLKQQVADAADNANKAIDTANNDAAIKTAEDNGIAAINGIHVPSASEVLNQQKSDADKAIDNALKNKEDEIQNSTLPQAQKDDLNKQAQDTAKTAKDNIAKATNAGDVTKAQNDGVNAIDGIHVPSSSEILNQQKNDADKAIDNALKNKEDEIKNSTLPQAQKDDLNKQAKDTAKTAKDNINKATNAGDVTKAQNDGVNAINGIHVPSASEILNQQKNDADKAIDNALKNKEDEIKNSTLPQAQKDDLNKQAKDTAKTAKDNINKATNAGDVTKAQNDGVNAINGIHVPSASEILTQQKSDANKAIDNALKNKEDEIKNSTLPQAQKDDLTKQAQDAAKTAKDNIAKATNAGDVTKAQNDGVKAINGIHVPSASEVLAQHKADADKTIDKALADKQNEINSSSLSDDQKSSLNQQAADAAKTAKDNIAKATTADGVSNAVFDGVKAINDVKVPSASEVLNQQKSEAIKQIDDALNQKTDEINADDSLNADQKSQLVNKADDLASQAKEAINSASDANAISQALNQGLDSIRNLSSADIDTNNNQNNGGNNSGNQNGNSGSDNTNNNGANNGAAGELNGNNGSANANGANAGHANAGTSNGANLNNGSLTAMAHAVKNANANAGANDNSKKLPQTGNDKNEALGLMGLAAAGLVGLFGAAKRDKKED